MDAPGFWRDGGGVGRSSINPNAVAALAAMYPLLALYVARVYGRKHL
jgi:hypothetical protein